MKEYEAKRIRNVAVVGHTNTGKTEILESILYYNKVTDRLGKAVDGTSIIDSDSEEVKRGISVYASVVPVEKDGFKINFINAPGYLDFSGEQAAAIAVADSVMIVVNAKDGIQPDVSKLFSELSAKKIPTFFFVTRCDEDHTDYMSVVNALEKKFKAAPIYLPLMENKKAVGVIDIIAQYGIKNGEVCDIPADEEDDVMVSHEAFKETIAMVDDELTEKYFEGIDFTLDDYIKGLTKGFLAGTIRPIFCGVPVKNIGLDQLLDGIIQFHTPYSYRNTIAATDPNGNKVTVETTPFENFSGFVWKTVNDNFAQISYIKVMSGTLTSDTPLYNVSKDATEKVGSIVVMRGNKQEKVSKLECGDIGAILKLQNTGTNDTLATKAKPVLYPEIQFPQGMLGKAIKPKTKNDEDKLSNALTKVASEDKSMKVVMNTETKEQVLYGIGDQHIDVIVNKLKNRYKVEVELTEPKVQYRETITGTSDVQGKYKKQNGGAGQYGDVTIKFEPNPDQEEMEFVDAVVGGVVPKNFIPAVEAGLRDCMNKGVLAGYKVVQVKATLHYGSYHPVDSKEVAFKSAARLAYKKGMPLAKPALLEPIIKAEVTIPSEYVGTIYGDFSKRRGIIMEQHVINDDLTVIVAEVPQAEMMNYATELRSMTQGNGSYTQEFIRYDKAPKDVTDKVVAAANIEDDDED